MNTTALANTPTEVAEPTVEPTAVAAAPAIEPKLAQLLEFTQKSQSTITPKEINAHLEQVLRDYDALTLAYARNNERLDAELTHIRQTGEATSGQLQQGLGTTQSHIGALDARVDALQTQVQSDLGALDTRITTVHGLLNAQDAILKEQSQRLDQFGVAQELLDTATRGNRNRIEAVREWAANQHAVSKAHIEGLRALQREHYSQFQAMQQMVNELRADTLRLEQALTQVSNQLDRHTAQTRRHFRWTHGAIAATVVLGAAGLAAFKWAPTFAPVATQQAIAQLDTRLADMRRQVTDLATLQTVVVEQDAKTAKLSGQLSKLESSVTAMGQSMNQLRAAQTLAALNSATGLPVHDAQWLLQQSPKAFTVQVLAADDPAEVKRFITRNAAQLSGATLSYTLTQRDGRERYNLFYGVFGNAAQARTALTALEPTVQMQQPWVRAMRSVQKTLP